MKYQHLAFACGISAFALSFVVAAVGFAASASAIDTKVYSGLGCRAAELPPAPQPTFSTSGTAFNQNTGQRLRLLCPVVKDSSRILEAKVRVVATNGNAIICTLRTVRDDGSTQQAASSTHLPYYFGNASAVREIHLNGQNASSTAIGSYTLECTLPSPVGGDAAGIIMYRVIED